jgi:hypothetical protein
VTPEDLALVNKSYGNPEVLFGALKGMKLPTNPGPQPNVMVRFYFGRMRLHGTPNCGLECFALTNSAEGSDDYGIASVDFTPNAEKEPLGASKNMRTAQ